LITFLLFTRIIFLIQLFDIAFEPIAHHICNLVKITCHFLIANSMYIQIIRKNVNVKPVGTINYWKCFKYYVADFKLYQSKRLYIFLQNLMKLNESILATGSM